MPIVVILYDNNRHLFMKKIVSHIWPLTKRKTSKINGPLEVTWINGKKVLDSQNANYSYGALQKVLEYGLLQIEMQQVNELLILGLGGGSVIKSLQNRFNYQGKITAVEIDDTIIQIAKDEFDIKENKQLRIIHSDAIQYVNHCKKCYDLIIVDIFIDHTVPESFYDQKFWSSLNQLVKLGGYIIFNAGIFLEDTSKIAPIKSILEPNTICKQHNKVEGVNTLLIGNKVM
ncbi:methyltransferase domain-containing protein [Aquimarina sp. AD10]|nr:methyltransferase domain-containing protein [Aquimarina sp. AD10]RKM95102.1 methyltransferase domain-containing protein [Aquimarina sp. AD10]